MIKFKNRIIQRFQCSFKLFFSFFHKLNLYFNLFFIYFKNNRNHTNRNNPLYSNSGISLVEVMVSVGLLAIIGIGLLSFYGNTLNQAKKIVKSGVCEQASQKIFSKIKNYKLDEAISNDFLPPIYTNIITNKNPSSNVITLSDKYKIRPEIQNRFNFFGNTTFELYKVNPGPPVGASEYSHFINNGVISFMPLLSNNYMGKLGDLYISGYTKNAGLKPLPSEFKVDSTQFQNQKVLIESSEIQINLYERKTNKDVDDIAKFWPVPENRFHEQSDDLKITNFYPISKNKIIISQFPEWIKDQYGFNVTVKSKLKFPGNNTTEECSSNQYFSYNADLQNMLDYNDFSAINGVKKAYYNITAKNIKDKTIESSNKSELILSNGTKINNSSKIAPLFTNINMVNMDTLGRNRDECSQDGSETIKNFHIKLKINNLQKDSGLIPLCIDNSKQWLTSNASTGGWCKNNFIAPPGLPNGNSGMPIDATWKTSQTGWIPCEKLTFCDLEPDRVEVKTTSIFDPILKITKNDIEYKYYYDDIKLDSELLNPKKKLWGCELKYMTAVVDVAGNLSYPPGNDHSANMLKLSNKEKEDIGIKVIPEANHEINPKVYFKPPPCYVCKCKPCKRGSGGFIGGLFKWVILAVLIVATAYVALGLYTVLYGTLAGICALGDLGCQTDPSAITNAMTLSSGGYMTCQKFNNCGKCGESCSMKSPPGPRWSDTLESNIDNQKTLLDNSCSLEKETKSISYLLNGTALNHTVDIYKAYKIEIEPSATPANKINMDQYAPLSNPASKLFYLKYDWDENEAKEPRTVSPGDDVMWQYLNKSKGLYCVSINQCSKGKWIQKKEFYEYPYNPYDSASATKSDTEPLEGCFPLKTAYSIDWTNYPSGETLPALGKAECIAIDFTKGYFNQTGDKLRGRSEFDYLSGKGFGCGEDSGNELNPPNTNTSEKRAVGVKLNDTNCTSPTEFTDSNGNIVPIKLAVPEAINDYSYPTSGATPVPIFKCWKQCVPPVNTPELYGGKKEQKYYETYNPSTDKALKFCDYLNLKEEDFDQIDP